MHKSLCTLAAAALAGASLTAQAPDPCGPAVWFVDPNTGQKTTTAQQFPELGNLSFNTTDVAQLFVIPNPAGTGPAYLGMATVTKQNATDYDFLSFTWTPGSIPTVTTDADTLNGPADEFQGSLSLDGLKFCGDTGAGHPVGNGNPIVASRAALGQQFGNIAPMTGIPGGYIDPQLGRIGGQDVVFYAAPTNDIQVGDIDLNPASTNFGNVTNVRTAIPAQSSIPAFQFLHSPTPVYDQNGEARSLIFSVYALNTGSDGFFCSTAELPRFPSATAVLGMKPTSFYDDGGDWNANPLSVKGTHVYADASGGYGDPLRIESFICSSTTVPSAGGTATNVALLPLSVQNDTVAVAFNYGVTRLPTPFDPNTLGIPGYGLLCVSPVLANTTGPAANLESASSFTLAGPLPGGAVLLVEAVAFNVTQSEVYISNEAFLEIL